MSQPRREILDLLTRHGVRPSRRLGQHFLADPNIVRRIVDLAAPGPGTDVVEIGAGTGALTRALASTGARVRAYEVDESLRPLLEDALAGREVDLRFADAAALDLASELGPGPWSLVANLPYNVGTQIVLDVLRHVPAVTTLVVMLQLEVAERLAAAPGAEAYGLPSVVARLHSDVRLAFRVPPQVFVPPPRVGSAVVVAHRRPAHPRAEEAIALAAAAFGQRRKMLRRSLAGVLDDVAGALAAAGIEPTRRPEELGPEEWVRLAEAARG